MQASYESVEIIAERIQQRARSIVDTIYPDYLRLFDSYFQRWALELAESPILTVDSQLYDFVNNPAHLKEIIDRIEYHITTHSCLEPAHGQGGSYCASS